MNTANVENYVKSIIAGISSKNAIEKELIKLNKSKNYHILALGKAAWEMANITKNFMLENVKSGLVITKHGHSMGTIDNFEIIEAGHPIPDNSSIIAGKKAIEFLKSIPPEDDLIFLLSGGGSSLMETPIGEISLESIQDITSKLLSRGANIVEINTIRKHLSKVKGGRLAEYFSGNKVRSIIISDVLSDRIDSIASGPMVADRSTKEEALSILKNHEISADQNILGSLELETPKMIHNVDNKIILNVTKLCEVAKDEINKYGYDSYILTTDLNCEAKEAGKFIASMAKSIKSGNSTIGMPCALIFGGETIVNLTGNGMGGRNQELALAAALEIDGEDNIIIIAFGSDGTDGPTDAAGGFVNGKTISKLKEKGVDPLAELKNNNSYYTLNMVDSLLFTGPTGTNLNDVYIAIIG